MKVQGLPDGEDFYDEKIKKRVNQATGKKLGQCYRDDDHLTIGDIKVERKTVRDSDSGRDIKSYCFSVPPIATPPHVLPVVGDTKLTPELQKSLDEGRISPYPPPDVPPINPPEKPTISPNTPEGCGNFIKKELGIENGESQKSMQPSGGQEGQEEFFEL